MDNTKNKHGLPILQSYKPVAKKVSKKDVQLCQWKGCVCDAIEGGLCLEHVLVVESRQQSY